MIHSVVIQSFQFDNQKSTRLRVWKKHKFSFRFICCALPMDNLFSGLVIIKHQHCYWIWKKNKRFLSEVDEVIIYHRIFRLVSSSDSKMTPFLARHLWKSQYIMSTMLLKSLNHENFWQNIIFLAFIGNDFGCIAIYEYMDIFSESQSQWNCECPWNR